MNVPKLRFKEFTDEWSTKRICDVATVTGGGTPSTDNSKYWNGDIQWFTPSEIGKTKYISNSSRTITKDGLKNSSAKLLPIGTILLSSRATIGEASILTNVASTNQGFQSLIVDEKYNNEFIFYLKNKFQKEMLIKAFGSTFLEISKSNIENIKIILPTLNEQNKIANFLSLLDKKIELQTKKIEDLKLYKLYMQSKLLSENISGEVCISQLGSVVTGTTPSKSENSYWENGEITWITPSDINDKRDVVDSCIKLTNQGLKNGRFIPRNSVLVTCIASIGKNAVLKTDGSCNQQINAIIPNEKYNYNYIYYLVENISKHMQSIAGTSATSIINKEQFSNLIVKVHNKEWQDKIDVILSAFETKANLETEKLNKINELKKGLMQKMFV